MQKNSTSTNSIKKYQYSIKIQLQTVVGFWKSIILQFWIQTQVILGFTWQKGWRCNKFTSSVNYWLRLANLHENLASRWCGSNLIRNNFLFLRYMTIQKWETIVSTVNRVYLWTELTMKKKRMSWHFWKNSSLIYIWA